MQTQSRYHAGCNIYFRRDIETGDVILEYFQNELVRLDCHTWASVLASVSKRGESADTFHEALNFHMGVGQQ